MSIARDLGRLARELAPHGVTTVLWSNREWKVDGTPIEKWFSGIAGIEVPHHGAHADSSPARQTKNSAYPIMERYGAQPCETALVGGIREDMIAGVQNKLLLLRPTWYGQHMEYGFSVETISELARVCFVFGLREHPPSSGASKMGHSTSRRLGGRPVLYFQGCVSNVWGGCQGVRKGRDGESQFLVQLRGFVDVLFRTAGGG